MNISQFFTQFFAGGLDRSLAMPATYDLSLVLASYVIAALAGYAFLRLTTLIAELSKSASRATWMVAGALTMGLGTWAMHFVAMLAYRLPIPVGYDPVVTAISLVPAVLGSGVALHVVARRTVTLLRLLVGGVFMGAGIGTMHYTGMAAMRFDALVRYDPLLFATSIVVAVVLAFIALSVTFWTVTRRKAAPSLGREAVGAGIMGLAVAGMHYTAMTSTLCLAEPGLHLGVFSIDPKVFAAVTTAVAVAILVIAIIAVIFDRRLDAEISRRESAADRARRMDERLMDAIETMPDSLAVFDPDETLVLCNSLFRADYAEAADILVPGVTFEDIMRRRVERLWSHESPERKNERLAKHMRGFREPGPPLVSRARNGRWSLIRERRTVDGGIVRVETDITAVKEAEELATLREQRLTLIMNNVADALLTLDADGNVESFNPSAETIFGYAAGEVVGRNVAMILAGFGDHIDDLRKPASGEPAAANPVAPKKGPQEVTGLHKSGRKISTELVVTRAREGERTIFIVALRDVTERRAIQAQLQHAQKMEAVGQLTGGIAHDFNNLLGVIIGNLDLLKEKVAGGSEEDSLIGAALDFALRGAELNKRLLAFSRRQSLQPERIDVNEVLAGMTVLLTRAVGERVAVRLHPGRGISRINVDLAQLESALLNLTVNARDAMPEGGTLTIETTRTVVDDDNLENHPGMATGDYVCISVADDGTGMTPDVQARAFEPFFTTKAIGAGSGLGLSMVFGFIKQSDGYVTIYSEPGRGTVVRLYLPRAIPNETEATDRYEADRETESPTGTETVLVVEDNEAMARIAMKQLQDLGYSVIETRNAAEALTVIEGGTPIDLLFTDVVMPGAIDGVALAHKAITLRPDLKILLTSGFPQRACALPERAGEVPLPALLLTKPYRKQRLAKSIRQALDQARTPERTA